MCQEYSLRCIDTNDVDHEIFGYQKGNYLNLMNVFGSPVGLTEDQKYILIRNVATEIYEPIIYPNKK